MMTFYAIAVFVVAHGFIISERFNKTTVALIGAELMVCLPVIDFPDVFYSQDSGMNWDVIFLMLGMMMIVSILRETGVFEFAAICSAKRAKGSPLRIMILLMVVMAFASAILPNVVSVLLIAPVTLLVCDRLEINPVPMLMAEVFASNIGGAATLVGDPPNIIIGAHEGPVVQRLPGEHGTDRRHHLAGTHRHVAAVVPRLFHGRSRPDRRCHVVERA
jgi:Na+/H+ antiporter NhaD/arsenite permease-like protein